jgi:hypothetical protein
MLHVVCCVVHYAVCLDPLVLHLQLIHGGVVSGRSGQYDSHAHTA